MSVITAEANPGFARRPQPVSRPSLLTSWVALYRAASR